ncbi:hypothetical protein FPV67DRAFT_387972 [Lyophyllum atratum]|nr:hypothetical protein FPV67DRAFT_387972 [Lyophyllum atratum]
MMPQVVAGIMCAVAQYMARAHLGQPRELECIKVQQVELGSAVRLSVGPQCVKVNRDHPLETMTAETPQLTGSGKGRRERWMVIGGRIHAWLVHEHCHVRVVVHGHMGPKKSPIKPEAKIWYSILVTESFLPFGVLRRFYIPVSRGNLLPRAPQPDLLVVLIILSYQIRASVRSGGETLILRSEASSPRNWEE